MSRRLEDELPASVYFPVVYYILPFHKWLEKYKKKKKTKKYSSTSYTHAARRCCCCRSREREERGVYKTHTQQMFKGKDVSMG